MTTTSETLNKEQLAQLNRQEAESNLEKYLQLKTQKAAITASMKGYEVKLKNYFDNNKDLRNDKGQLVFDGGYVYNGKETKVKFPKRFSIVKFIQKFPALIKWEFSISGMKSFFANEKTKEQMKGFGLKLVEEPKFEIVAAKAEKQNS